MREWLPALAVDRPVTVLMSFLALMVLGVIAWTRVPVQLMPSGFEPSVLWVSVPWSNASPRETDDRIVRPIAAELGTVPGIQNLVSTASSGRASFSITFHGGVNMSEAYNNVVDRIERAMVELPDDVERYWVYKYNPSDDPIVWAGVSFPPDVEDPHFVMTRVVQPRLERLAGVASMDVWGVPRRVVRIDYHRDALFAHGINLGEVQGRLASDNFQLGAGILEDRGQLRNLRGLSLVSGVEELARFPVRDALVLSDIATVRQGAVASAQINRINGQDAAAFAVRKESTANAVATAALIEEALAELEGDPRVQGAKFFVFFNQGQLIGDSMSTLGNTALTGGLFALVILWVFLREWRMTLLIAAAIPFSMMITVAIIYFRGGDLNLIAMMGLMLAVGMVVDNAIVVVETIYRRRAEGASARDAAIQGTAEVNLAIVLSTATTMVVFLPVILMSENAGFSFFLGVLGFPVIFALLASLLVALVFAPLTTRYLPTGRVRPDARWLAWLTASYTWVLGSLLRRRLDALAVLTAVAMLTVTVAVPGVRCTGSADTNLNDFSVRFTVPPQADIYARDAVMGEIESVLAANREAWGVRVYRGRVSDTDREGRLFVYLLPDAPMTRDEVMAAARKAMPKDIPGVTVSIGWEGGGRGSTRSLSVQVEGEDMNTLEALAGEAVRRLREVDSVVDARIGDLEQGADEIRLNVRRDATARYGLDAQQVGQTVAFALRGTALPPLREGEREIDVASQFSLADRSDISTVLDFQLWSPALMSLVPVRAVTDVAFGRGPSSIRRTNRRTSVEVVLDLEEGVAPRDLWPQIDEALADMALPRGYDVRRGSSFDQQAEDDAALTLALLLSVCFVFLLMGMLFESFVLPLAVITTIPMAFAGAFWMLWLTDTPMDMMAGIGVVVLVGVVVNNGIVLVDLVTQLRRDGMSRADALVEAGRRRLRPILMTALTTICGLLPMAFGSTSFIGIPYAPLGRTVIGGMFAATLLTLFFVPFLYTVLDDLREGGWRFLGLLRQPIAKESSA